MTPEYLLTTARMFKVLGQPTTTLWTPADWKAPKGFPRRTLLCVPIAGCKTWTVSTDRLLAWLEKNQ